MSKAQRSPWLYSWFFVTFAIGTAMVLSGINLAQQTAIPPYKQTEVFLLLATGIALLPIALVGLGLRMKAPALMGYARSDEVESSLQSRNPYVTLFLVSFAILFIEVMFIRYCASQVRIFAFYKNIPLVGCFLGLGLGCSLGAGRTRHVLAFLLWMIPVTAFLSQGALLIDESLGRWTALASSEYVLGDELVGNAQESLTSQFWMSLFCVATLVALASLFCLLGRILGDAFERVPRLTGYTVNIIGSLAGILLFVGLSYLQTPPWIWFIVGLSPLIWWAEGAQRILAGGLIAVASLMVSPSVGDTVWSPYQKLVGHHMSAEEVENIAGFKAPAYLVQISDVFYQVAMDLRPEAIASTGANPFPHYDRSYERLSKLDRVLVVGAGTGNDVAAALRAGVKQVDAVDIDPAIIDLGRKHHPERPYSDPRVNVIIEDARAAFRTLPSASYDAVVFGLLDSHTQLGISSLRLDNYVFTLESLREARRLLKPGGSIVLTAVTFREWFHDRFVGMLEATCGSPVTVTPGVWSTYECQPRQFSIPAAATGDDEATLPTDDWPFLYLPNASIPTAYVLALTMLAIASVVFLRLGGLTTGRLTSSQAHLFFLGAGFLLMEVYAINRLALLFGTSWLVSAIAIALVLILIVAANLTVAAVRSNLYPAAYAGLLASLLVSYSLDPSAVLGHGVGYAIGYSALTLSPVYFAGLVFARSFSVQTSAGPAIGANILGSVLGGWAEYATMATGIRSMALLALLFYFLSLVFLWRWKTRGTHPPAERTLN